MSELVYSGNQLPSKNDPDFAKLLAKVIQSPKKEFPYTRRITRHNPTAFVFMIDQSGSMSEKVTVNGETTMKADFLATVINQTLNELVDRCKKNTDVRDYFHISILGYGGDRDNTAKILWEGNLKGKIFVTPSELINNHIGTTTVHSESKRPDGTVKKLQKNILQWIKPKATGLTPMRQAYQLAHDILVQWIHQYPQSYPPAVINITDGEANDCSEDELLQAAGALRELHTDDGNVLVFNIHISDSTIEPIYFPCTKNELPSDDEYAKLMFDMSSDLPGNYNKAVAEITQKDLIGAYTAIVVNAPISRLISLLNIGTNTNVIDHS
jgi:uncharacterized protein YegL